jgi:hypothetical protein
MARECELVGGAHSISETPSFFYPAEADEDVAILSKRLAVCLLCALYALHSDGLLLDLLESRF